MKIQILGSGCPTCKKFYQLTQKAVSELNLDTKVEYLAGDKGTQKIIQLGVMTSPVLTINDQVVMTGFTPDLGKLKKTIQAAAK